MPRPKTAVFRDLPVSIWTEWSFDAIRIAVDKHDLGQFAASAQLAETMLRDDRVAATLNTRVLGLLGLPRKVEAGPDGDKRRGKVAAKALEAGYPRMLALESMAQALRWAVLLRFALCEVLWSQDDASDLWTFTLKVWHPMFVWYDIANRIWKVNTQDGTLDVTPGDGKWFLLCPDGFYRGWIHGAVRSLGVPWLGRQYAFRDWLRYCEVHGLPIRGAVVPSEAPEEEKDRFFTSLANIGSEGTVLLPAAIGDGKASWDLKLIESTDRSWQTFQAATEDCDKRIAITLLGQNLTTEVQGGSYAAAKVHGQVRQDYLEADARSLAEQLREQVLKPWARFNWGDEELAPTLEWETEPPDDLATKSQTLVQVATALSTLATAGVRDVDARELLEQYDVPLLTEAQVDDLEADAQAKADAIAQGGSPDGSGDGQAPADDAPPDEPPVPALTHRLARDPGGLHPAAVAGQLYTDDVADRAAGRGAEALAPDVEAVLAALAKGESYADARKRILAAYRSMAAPKALADVVAKASVMTHLAGRAAAASETDGNHR